MRSDLKKYKQCNYIDEIYEYSAETFEFSKPNRGGYTAGFFSLFLMVFANLPYIIQFQRADKIAIARGEVHRRVLIRALGKILIINDDIKRRDFALYRIGRRRDRFFFLFGYCFKQCRKERKQISYILKQMGIESGKRRELSKFLDRRIAHACYFKWAIDMLLRQIEAKEVYVSYTHDRFALITEEICKKNNIYLTCIPHGEIENTKLPRRYPGDRVYLLNERLVRSFNNAYKTTAYVYDHNLLKRIYTLGKKNAKNGKVVYLMMPHFLVNEQLLYVSRIAKYLKERSIKLFVKQHPIHKYDITGCDNVEEVVSLEEAVCGNMCIGFFTTALIDAIFNDSRSISILRLLDDDILYQKNKDVFEGCGVLCVRSDEELFSQIDQYLCGI